MSPQNDRDADPEIGRVGPRGKHLRQIDLWVDPVMGKELVEGFFYGDILFMGLVDLNRVLISTKSTNWYSCYEIQVRNRKYPNPTHPKITPVYAYSS